MHILVNIRPIEIKYSDKDEGYIHACKKTGVVEQAHFL
jgi:hypothetical protein